MKSKAPLALMEQMVMLLVFAFAAALCLQAFAQSDEISRRSEERDQASMLCQSVAEIIQHEGGIARAMSQQADNALGNVSGGYTYHPETDTYQTYFDASWNPVYEQKTDIDGITYVLSIAGQRTQTPGLGQARVWASLYQQEQDCLFDLTVRWQEEVASHG